MSYSQRSNYQSVFIVIIGVIFLISSLTWANYRYTKANPGGNDFMVHWLGTRMLILEGVSPYSDDTAQAIQTFAYGRPAKQGEHELRVAYPLYSIIAFLPFSLIENFSLARAIWMTFMEIGLILLAFLSIRLTDWKPTIPIIAIFIIFSVLWYHSLRPLINGNIVILIALLQVGGLLSIKNGGDELAGVLFAFSSIKPQLSILFILFIVYWALRHKRLKIIIWFASTLILLILSAMLLIPDWLVQNFYEIMRYPQYNPPISLQTSLAEFFPAFGARIGWAITGILSVVLLFEWGIIKSKGFQNFLWGALLTLLISQWIGIPTDPGNFIILLPLFPLLFAAWERRWGGLGRIVAIISMLVIFAGIWLLFVNSIQPGYQPQQSPLLFIPLPLFLLVMVYWARWWIIQPVERLSEELIDENEPFRI